MQMFVVLLSIVAIFWNCISESYNTYISTASFVFNTPPVNTQ